MKKTYLNPTTDIMFVEVQQLMQQASPGGGVNTGDKPGDDYNPDDPSYSRRRTVWDDEEEEDY